MATAVYLLACLVSLACAVLLLRRYARGRRQLLLWSGLCFAGLALDDFLVFLDLVVLPTAVDLFVLRLATTAASLAILLFGLIWESGR